jgi:hypothetical protein
MNTARESCDVVAMSVSVPAVKQLIVNVQVLLAFCTGFGAIHASEVAEATASTYSRLNPQGPGYGSCVVMVKIPVETYTGALKKVPLGSPVLREGARPAPLPLRSKKRSTRFNTFVMMKPGKLRVAIRVLR